MRRELFTVSGTLTFELVTGSGDVEVLSSGRDELFVELRGGPEEDYTVELNGSDLVVRPPTKRSGKRRFASTDIKLFVPSRASGEIRVASGDVVIGTELHELTVATASGDIRVDASIARDFSVKTASGDIKTREIGGHVFVATASGDVTVEDVGGDLTFNSASGDLRVGTIAGMVEVKGVSADVSIDAVAGHTVRARTLSGDVRLGIPPGRTVDLDMQTLSGEVVNRLSKSGGDPGPNTPLALSVKTVSGNLKLDSV
ncbi:MAG: DUF4097 family beta strand repeat protein [Acidimicrobiia bacterium]|nr:DUF4097 family beta strand repeat protein [Acidimicrobiia bacterium]